MSNEDLDTNPDLDVHEDDLMQEIHEFDFQRAVMLMQIAEKVATVTPRSTSLLGLAQAELEYMNQQAKDIARRRAERQQEAEQRRYEAEQARINREHEAAADAAIENDEPIPEKPVPQPPQQPGMPQPERRF